MPPPLHRRMKGATCECVPFLKKSVSTQVGHGMPWEKTLAMHRRKKKRAPAAHIKFRYMLMETTSLTQEALYTTSMNGSLSFHSLTNIAFLRGLGHDFRLRFRLRLGGRTTHHDQLIDREVVGAYASVVDLLEAYNHRVPVRAAFRHRRDGTRLLEPVGLRTHHTHDRSAAELCVRHHLHIRGRSTHGRRTPRDGRCCAGEGRSGQQCSERHQELRVLHDVAGVSDDREAEEQHDGCLPAPRERPPTAQRSTGCFRSEHPHAVWLGALSQ